MNPDVKSDHIQGNFEWEIEPYCCDEFKNALDEKFIFVSNFTDSTPEKKGFNILFYMMPVTVDGYFARSDGLAIYNCPWCGTEIKGRKKYPIT